MTEPLNGICVGTGTKKLVYNRAIKYYLVVNWQLTFIECLQNI